MILEFRKNKKISGLWAVLNKVITLCTVFFWTKSSPLSSMLEATLLKLFFVKVLAFDLLSEVDLSPYFENTQTTRKIRSIRRSNSLKKFFLGASPPNPHSTNLRFVNFDINTTSCILKHTRNQTFLTTFPIKNRGYFHPLTIHRSYQIQTQIKVIVCQISFPNIVPKMEPKLSQNLNQNMEPK